MITRSRATALAAVALASGCLADPPPAEPPPECITRAPLPADVPAAVDRWALIAEGDTGIPLMVTSPGGMILFAYAGDVVIGGERFTAPEYTPIAISVGEDGALRWIRTFPMMVGRVFGDESGFVATDNVLRQDLTLIRYDFELRELWRSTLPASSVTGLPSMGMSRDGDDIVWLGYDAAATPPCFAITRITVSDGHFRDAQCIVRATGPSSWERPQSATMYRAADGTILVAGSEPIGEWVLPGDRRTKKAFIAAMNQDRSLRWVVELTPGMGQLTTGEDVEAYGRIPDPLVVGDRRFTRCGHYDLGTRIHFDLADGRLRTAVSTPNYQPRMVFGDTRYTSTGEGMLAETMDGRPLWRFEAGLTYEQHPRPGGDLLVLGGVPGERKPFKLVRRVGAP